MDNWDRELEQRVWRRVRGEADGKPDLSELIQLSQAQAADLKTIDGELYRQERQTLALLTGLYALSGNSAPHIPPAPGNLRQRLARCRERCRRILQMLLALENHDRYGALFTDLTRQQRAKCARLEQLWSRQPGRRSTY